MTNKQEQQQKWTVKLAGKEPVLFDHYRGARRYADAMEGYEGEAIIIPPDRELGTLTHLASEKTNDQ